MPVGEIAGAGVPKLKFTVGAFSAPGCAAKNGRGAKPKPMEWHLGDRVRVRAERIDPMRRRVEFALAGTE